MENDEDLAAVRAVVAGNASAFRSIVERWQGPLFNLAYRFCRDRSQAADMAQDIQSTSGNRQPLNRILMLAPIVCSLLALGLVLGNVVVGTQPQADEGTSAHLFQLLIAAQLPLVLLFAATANWTRPARPLLALFVQALAGLAALGALAWAGY